MTLFRNLILFLLLATVPAWAQDQEDVDYLSLAAVLIRDGNYARASEALKNVAPNLSREEKHRFHSLRGLVHLNRKQYTEAESDLAQAIALGSENKSLYLYLAQAQLAQDKLKESLQSIDKAGSDKKEPKIPLLRSAALWKLERQSEAWDVLTKAETHFPNRHEFPRQRFLYLMDLKLYQQALEHGFDYLKRFQASPKDYVLLAASLRQSGQIDRALLLMESAKLMFANNEDVLLELAHLYLEKEQTLTAAGIFEQLSKSNTKYLAEAAELYRRAGKTRHALFLNAEMTDQPQKLKQRLAIFIEDQEYEKAQAMGPALSRLGLLADEDIRYALAYANFQVGHFEQVENHLRFLTRPDLFRKAIALRESINQCESDVWQCNI